MYNLPERTLVNKQLPKTAVYKKFNLSAVDKAKFDADVSRLEISAEISPATVSVAPGENVSSIFAIRVLLKKQDFDEKSITMISKLIDQKLVLVLVYKSNAKLAIFHKKLFMTEWQSESDISLPIQGLNLDIVYHNMIMQIGRIHIENNNTLLEQIAEDERKAKLLKEIERLEKLARKEKQPRKKFELHQKIYKMKKLFSEY